jgi:hypothetical protein
MPKGALWTVALLALAAGPGVAEKERAPQRRVLVELFTSQG